MSLEHAMLFTDKAQRIAHDTEDHTEALHAVAEKRKPIWKGR